MSIQTLFRKTFPIAVLPLAMGASLLAPSVLIPHASSQAFSAPKIKSGVSSRGTALFRSLGVLQSGATQTRTLVLLPSTPKATSKSAKVSSQAVKANATGPLTFTFQGYSASQKKTLSDFLRGNYSRMVALWGEPAAEQRGQNIVIENGGPSDAAYQPPAVGSDRPGGTVYYAYVDNATAQVNTYNLTRLVFLAFWGAQIPSFNFNEAQYVEPWIYGMSDAAALQIAYQAAGSPSNFDPSFLGGYLLPVYDFFNRPELSSAYIYPPNVTTNDNPILALSDIRLTMAQGAFLKIAAENPSFYSQFNTAYYAAVQPRKAVSPDQLKSIAAGVVPTVEGTAFRDWVRRQYSLDATITTGQKLYFGLLPRPAETTNATLSGFNGYAQAFTTDAQGNEVVSTGYGSVQAISDAGVDLRSSSPDLTASNVINFSESGYEGQGVNYVDRDGNRLFNVGFRNFGADKARVTIKVRYKEAEASNYFPYNVAGGPASASSFYGVTAGADSGTLTVNNSENVAVARGAFKATTVYSPSSAVKTQFTFNGTTLRRNTAWFKPGIVSRSTAFLLEVPPASSNINFSVASGASRLRMVTFPLIPVKTDEAQMLNVSPSALELARYRPNLSPAKQQGDALVFGISTDRHEVYPNITEGVAPGRGYWFAVGGSGFSTTILGSEPSRTKPYEVPLLGGWNQFGVPFNKDFATGAIKVRYGGFSPVTLAVAQSRGWITPGIWRWLAGGGYKRTDEPDSGGSDLKAFEGYYIFANPERGVSLVFDASAQTAKLAARTGWNVPVLVSGAKNRDDSTRFGVSADSNIAKPPTATKVVTLRFVENGSDTAANAGSGLAESFVPTLTGVGTWTAILDGTTAGEQITISWGNLKSVPKTVTLTLLDQKTGTTKKMSSGGKYKFKADGAPRRFTFTATPKTSKSKTTSSASVKAS